LTYRALQTNVIVTNKRRIHAHNLTIPIQN